MSDVIVPHWPAPRSVRALQTTRLGGVSTGPYRSLNLGDHTGDDPSHVAANRARLAEAAELPGDVQWMRQVHGNGVASAESMAGAGAVQCDAATAHTPGLVCAVLTADCLPVLMCSRDGRAVAAAHAGWRGLAGGVLEAAVAAMGSGPDDLMAWLGPAIGPDAFEVGSEVRAAFLERDEQSGAAFKSGAAPDKYYADLHALARLALQRSGLASNAIYGGQWCTFSDDRRFFSYRRDGVCGRMASLIWIEPC